MLRITQNPTTKYGKICWFFFLFFQRENLKDHGEIKTYCPTEKALCLQTRNICIVIYSHTEQRKASGRQICLLQVCMEIQPLFWDLVRSPCPVVDLKGFGRHSQGKTPLLCGSGWATRDPNTCPLYCSPYLTIGMGKGEEWSVFQARMRLESIYVWGMRDLSPTPGYYIHHTLGFKSKPLHVFAVIVAFSKCSFILHCIIYIKTRSEKILFGPFFFMTVCEFQSTSGLRRERKVLSAFIWNGFIPVTKMH